MAMIVRLVLASLFVWATISIALEVGAGEHFGVTFLLGAICMAVWDRIVGV